MPKSKNHEAGLERIKKLERLLAASPVNSLQYRNLAGVIKIEATAYRKSLDVARASRTLDPRPTRTIA